MAEANRDVQSGANLRTLRGSMSQGQLAGLMKEQGYRWRQNTVSSVELGERPLRLDEAAGLMRVLELDPATVIEDLTGPAVNAGRTAAERRLKEAQVAVSAAAEEMLAATEGVAEARRIRQETAEAEEG